MLATIVQQGYHPNNIPVATANRGRTQLVNDPAHPFDPQELAAMQRWVDRSYIPTVKGRVVMSKGVPLGMAVGEAGLTGTVGQTDPTPEVYLNTPNRFALFHELAHANQSNLSEQQKAKLQAIFHYKMPAGYDFYGPTDPKA